MALLRAVEPGPVSDSLQLRSTSAREAASTPEESYDRASLFRGRKSRPRADCCNTTAPRAIDARRDLRSLLQTAIRIVRWLSRVLLPSWPGASLRSFPGTAQDDALQGHILPSCSPRSMVRDTFS